MLALNSQQLTQLGLKFFILTAMFTVLNFFIYSPLLQFKWFLQKHILNSPIATFDDTKYELDSTFITRELFYSTKEFIYPVFALFTNNEPAESFIEESSYDHVADLYYSFPLNYLAASYRSFLSKMKLMPDSNLDDNEIMPLIIRSVLSTHQLRYLSKQSLKFPQFRGKSIEQIIKEIEHRQKKVPRPLNTK